MKLISWSFLGLCFGLTVISPVLAQITTDGSTNTNLTPTDSGVRIDNGSRAGGNLFHSFREFSVPRGSEAFFNNASDIVNIFSRVTGGNISNIDGLIRANGAANLFLINPAGIIFGESASLQIGGSFYGSTADSILFPDGVEFSAVNTQIPILTINAPIGLNFRDNPGEIVNRSFALNRAGDDFVGLEVAPGNTLGLVGGNVSFEFAEATANSGRIELGGLSNAGTVTLNDDGSLSFPEDVARADITISNAADIDVTGTGEGSITINGRNVRISAGDFGFSAIRAGITADSTSAEAQAGDITINATDNVTVDSSVIFNRVDSGAVGDGGSVTITTGSLSVTNGAIIDTSTSGQGNAGNVNINGAETVSIDNFAGIFTNVDDQATINSNAGDINITTGSLTVDNDSLLDAGTTIQGVGGNITINATEDVSFSNFSGVNILAGNGGSITVNALNLEINSGSGFFAGISESLGFSSAQAGNIVINATETVTVAGEGFHINNFIDTNSIGNTGNILITAKNINFTDGGNIFTTNSGQGNIGDITLTATEEITFSGSISTGIFSFVINDAQGDLGDVNITANNFSLTGGANINQIIDGIGQGGDIRINANSINLDGEDPNNSSVIIGTRVTGNGNSGEIFITTNNFILNNGGQINTSGLGQGDAGNITIKAMDSFVIRNNSFITSNIGSRIETPAIGRVGNITISSRDISLSDTSQIQAGAFPNATATQPGIISLTATERISFTGTDTAIFSNNDRGSLGNASNVRLSAPHIAFNDGAGIIASNAGNGQGGDITIEGEVLTLNASNIRTNTSGEGDAGSIDIDLTNSLELRESSSITAEVLAGATGTGGEVNIQTAQVTVNEGSQISTSTNGDGNAGELIINATDSIELDGSTAEARSGFFANAFVGSGDGGNIRVITDELKIRNGATISASNFQSRGLVSPGTGEAGNLTIEANSVTLDNDASIDAATRSGEGGIITLQVAEDIRLQNNSQISAQALEDANGGNININSRFIIAFPSSGNGNDIIANAQRGDGGNINITAEALLGIEERPLNPRSNDINASSEFGLDGNVTFNVPDTNNFQETAELSSNVVSAEAVAQDACAVGAGESGLVLKGKGGVPPAPNLPLSAAVLLDNGKTITPNFSQARYQQTTQNITSQIQPVKTSQGDIYPARGVIVREDGTVTLTAYPTNEQNQRIPHNPSSCSSTK